MALALFLYRFLLTQEESISLLSFGIPLGSAFLHGFDPVTRCPSVVSDSDLAAVDVKDVFRLCDAVAAARAFSTVAAGSVKLGCFALAEPAAACCCQLGCISALAFAVQRILLRRRRANLLDPAIFHPTRHAQASTEAHCSTCFSRLRGFDSVPSTRRR